MLSVLCADLRDAVVLQLDDSGHSHLHAPKHRHHLQDLIVKGRSAEDLDDKESVSGGTDDPPFPLSVTEL